MFGLGDFGDKSPSWFLKTLKLSSIYLVNLEIIKNALEQFIPNWPPKNVITRTNIPAKYQNFLITKFSSFKLTKKK